MKAGYTISALIHALALGWVLWRFTPSPLEVPHVDPIVAELITDDVSQITPGVTNAKPTPTPMPVVDKVGEVKEQPKDPTLTNVKKEDVTTPTAPPPSPPQLDPKPDPKPDPKVEPPKAANTPPPPPPPAAQEPPPEHDPLAEALRREEARRKEEDAAKAAAKAAEDARRRDEAAKKAAKKAADEARRREEARKRDEANSSLDRMAALIDKRTPQRTAVTGATVNTTASRGTTTGAATQLTQDELSRLFSEIVRQLYVCWSPPAGLDAKNLVVTVSISLNRDGSLESPPHAKPTGYGPAFQAAAESAVRAVQQCSPLRLPAAQYESWRELSVNFDPSKMF